MVRAVQVFGVFALIFCVPDFHFLHWGNQYLVVINKPKGLFTI